MTADLGLQLARNLCDYGGLPPSAARATARWIREAIRKSVAEEREACARLVEAGLEDDDAGLSDEICRRDVDLAAAIRARGQQ